MSHYPPPPPVDRTRTTDIFYKLLAATGLLLDLFSEVDSLSLSSPIFTMTLKRDAQKFWAGLERAEAHVTGRVDSDRTESLDQLADSYHLVGRLLDIHLQAGRLLSEEGRLLLSQEIEEVVAKYGIKIEQ